MATKRRATAAATEAAQVRWAERRLELADTFGALAEQALSRARSEKSSARAVRELMEVAGIAIDAAELLSGHATRRTETLTRDPGDGRDLGHASD